MAHTHRTRFGSAYRAGFTLIEILIVMVMLGALLAVALPRVGRTITRDRVLRSAVVAQGMLDEATQFAARLRVPVDVDLSSGTIIVRNRETGEVLRARTFGADQDLRASVTFSPTGGITIFPNGRADAGLRISLSGGEYTTVVSRTPTGIVRRE